MLITHNSFSFFLLLYSLLKECLRIDGLPNVKMSMLKNAKFPNTITYFYCDFHGKRTLADEDTDTIATFRQYAYRSLGLYYFLILTNNSFWQLRNVSAEWSSTPSDSEVTVECRLSISSHYWLQCYRSTVWVCGSKKTDLSIHSSTHYSLCAWWSFTVWVSVAAAMRAASVELADCAWVVFHGWGKAHSWREVLKK